MVQCTFSPHSLQVYLSKQRSTFLPLLGSIAACVLAPMLEQQADRSTVNTIVLLYLLVLDENQEVLNQYIMSLYQAACCCDHRVVIFICEIMFCVKEGEWQKKSGVQLCFVVFVLLVVSHPCKALWKLHTQVCKSNLFYLWRFLLVKNMMCWKILCMSCD